MLYRRPSKVLSAGLSLALMCGLAVPAAAVKSEDSANLTISAKTSAYNDISGHWAQEAIERWSKYDVVHGFGEAFKPDDSLTRGQMAVVLSNTLGLTYATSPNPFKDVPDGVWYTDAVLRCHGAEIMLGSEGMATPEATIDRQQAMVMMARAFGIEPEENYDLSTYADGSQVASWAAGYVAAMVNAGIVNGVGDNMLCPADTINRASVMTILDRTVVQYINKSGTYELKNEDGLILVAASNVTLSGKTSADLLITPAAQNGTISFEKAEVTGDIIIQAQNVKVKTSADSKLPEFKMDGGSVEMAEDTKKPDKEPGGGGMGGGGGHNPDPEVKPESLTVVLKRGAENVTGKTVQVGDVLTCAITPDTASYDLTWTVGGTDRGSAPSYTVKPADGGLTIGVKVVGKDGTTGTATAATDIVAVPVDVNNTNADKAPVVLAENTTFHNETGEEVTIPESATISLKVSPTQDTASSDVTKALDTEMDKVLVDANVTAEAPAVNVIAMDVDLVVTTPAEGDAAATEQAVHPVGKTVLTLSREQLGLPADADLSLYYLVANHTNAKGEVETVKGEVVVVNDVECVRFTLNGLSRIWLGNIPPCTVTFDTNGGSAVAPVKVQFGHAMRPMDIPDAPTKTGWLFSSWDFDLVTYQVIHDMTVKALWVKGTPVPADQLALSWNTDPAPADVKLDKADGQAVVTLDQAKTYPANLVATLKITAPAGADKVAVGATAKDAMTADAQAITAELLKVEANATDANGKILMGSPILYLRWLDSTGKTISLQSARLVIRTTNGKPGSYDTQTRTETQNVNRGAGRVEAYLTGGTLNSTALPDYVGAINTHLRNLTMAVDVIFDEGFSADNGGWIDPNCYTGLKVVLTPFEGENLSKITNVSAGYWNSKTDTWIDLPVTAAAGDGSSMIYTMEKPNTWNVDMTYTYNGVEYTIGLNNLGWSVQDSTDVEAATWADVLTALARPADGKDLYVAYTGTEPVVLDKPLALKPYQNLRFENVDVGMTIVAGGKLSLEGNSEDSANFRLGRDAKLIVKQGGILEGAAQTEEANNYYWPQINGYTEIQDGGKLILPRVGFLRIYKNVDESGAHLYPTLNVMAGGAVESCGHLWVDGNNGGQLTEVSGTMTFTGDDVDTEFSTGLHLKSGAAVSSNNPRNSWRIFKVDGGMTVDAGATLTNVQGKMEISGLSENNGTINIQAGNLLYQNTCYSVYNNGTINVAAGAAMDATGTVLVNNGSLTGAGTLLLGESSSTENYDNGVDWAVFESNTTPRAPGNYDRNMFVRDAAKTVETVYFIGERSGSGSSTLTEQK